MPQGFLSAADRQRLNRFPNDVAISDIGQYYTLSSQDFQEVAKQRGSHNRLGFSLQLCTLRYLGFIPDDLLKPPLTLINWLLNQLGGSITDLQRYGSREQTRRDHFAQILTYTGFRRITPELHDELEAWLIERALEHDHPTFLLRSVMERLRWKQIVRPGLSVLERLVSRARVQAKSQAV